MGHGIKKSIRIGCEMLDTAEFSGAELSLKEIAEICECTEQGISIICVRAIKKLRRKIESDPEMCDTLRAVMERIQ